VIILNSGVSVTELVNFTPVFSGSKSLKIGFPESSYWFLQEKKEKNNMINTVFALNI
jgi:hypothetical protein